MVDPTVRFSSRVENYVRYRPGYPAGVADLLRREYGLTETSRIADIGSGTGLLARAFLDAGFEVTGVEPNRDMREAGDALLAGCPRFHSVDSRAEATGLPDASVDLVVAGQAFHWFEVEQTRREWQRILRPNGAVALIWNERHACTPFMRRIEEVVDAFAGARDSDGVIREAGRGRIGIFFAPASYRLDEFPNRQRFDFEGLRGRIVSSSYLPMEGEPDYDEMVRDLAAIFDRWQEGGYVDFEYRTKVFHGRLTAA